MIQFLLKFLLKPRILAVYHAFHLLLVATKLLTAKLHPRHVKESVSEILEARCRSRTFYHRLSLLRAQRLIEQPPLKDRSTAER